MVLLTHPPLLSQETKSLLGLELTKEGTLRPRDHPVSVSLTLGFQVRKTVVNIFFFLIMWVPGTELRKALYQLGCLVSFPLSFIC